MVLLVAQNLGIWLIVVWAMNRDELQGLQLIFSTLIAGTLAQSYLTLRFITKKIFGDINYDGARDDRPATKQL
jgi:hypothetical protein